jgi:hypothetical protein
MAGLLRRYNNYTLSMTSSGFSFMEDNPSLFYFGARQFVIVVGGKDSSSSCLSEPVGWRNGSIFFYVSFPPLLLSSGSSLSLWLLVCSSDFIPSSSHYNNMSTHHVDNGETPIGNGAPAHQGAPADLSYTDADRQEDERIVSKWFCPLAQEFPDSDDARIFRDKCYSVSGLHGHMKAQRELAHDLIYEPEGNEAQSRAYTLLGGVPCYDLKTHCKHLLFPSEDIPYTALQLAIETPLTAAQKAELAQDVCCHTGRSVAREASEAERTRLSIDGGQIPLSTREAILEEQQIRF